MTLGSACQDFFFRSSEKPQEHACSGVKAVIPLTAPFATEARAGKKKPLYLSALPHIHLLLPLFTPQFHTATLISTSSCCDIYVTYLIWTQE